MAAFLLGYNPKKSEKKENEKDAKKVCALCLPKEKWVKNNKLISKNESIHIRA